MLRKTLNLNLKTKNNIWKHQTISGFGSKLTQYRLYSVQSTIQEWKEKWKQNVDESPELKESLANLRETKQSIEESKPISALREADIPNKIKSAHEKRSKAQEKKKKLKLKTYRKKTTAREEKAEKRLEQTVDNIDHLFENSHEVLSPHKSRTERIAEKLGEPFSYDETRELRRLESLQLMLKAENRPKLPFRERWKIFKNWHKLKNVSPYEQIYLAEVFADKPVEKQTESSESEQTAVDDDGFRIETVDEEQVMTSSPDKSSESAVKSEATQKTAVQKESMQEKKESKRAENTVKRPSSRGKADEHMLVPTGNVVDHKVEQRSGGSELVVAPSGLVDRMWSRFKESKPIKYLSGIQQSIEESDNEVVQRSLEVASEARDGLSSLRSRSLPETETALAIKKIRELDPNFDIHDFTDLLSETIPRFLYANTEGNADLLRAMCGDSQFHQLFKSIKERQAQNIRYKSMIQQVRNFELREAILDGQEPILAFYFISNQSEYFLDAKGDVIEGSEDDIYSFHYLVMLQYDSDGPTAENPLGWRIQKFVRAAKFGPIW